MESVCFTMGKGRVGRRASLRGAWVVAVLAAAAPAAGEPVNVSLSATTGVLHDENFFRNSVNVEEKDLGSLGFSLRIGQERERLLWDLQYVPSFQREFDSPHFEAQDHRLELAATNSLSERTRVRVRERLLRSEVQTDLLSGSSAGAFVVVPQTERFEHSLDLGLSRDLGRRNGLELGLVHERFEYETTELFDSTVYGGSLGYSWRREDTTRLEVLGRLFRHEPSRHGATDIASAGVQYRKPLDRWHALTFDAGAFQARGPDVATGEDETENGWYGGVGYSWSPGRGSTASVTLRRDVAPLPGVGFSSVADLAQIMTTLTFRERLRLDLVGQGSRYRAIFESEAVTETLLGEARLRWQVREALELVGGVARIHQDSDVPALDGLDYDRFFFGASVPIYRRGRASVAPAVPPAIGSATTG